MNASGKRPRKKSGFGQLIIPLTALAILILFNLIRDPGFFSNEMAVNNNGNKVLSGWRHRGQLLRHGAEER